MRRKLGFAGVSALVATLMFAGGAIEAADQKPGSPEIGVDGSTESTKQYTTMKIYGIRVLIDQSTGRMKALSAEQAANLSAELRNRYPGVPRTAKAETAPKVLANGTVAMELDPSLMNYSVVRILPDGEVEYGCTKDHDHVADLIEKQASTPEKE